jgi:hypothetical protein
MKHSPANRPAYTLLEVLLASAIAVLLMAALYVGMDVQLRAVQAGREKVNETALVRNLIARMGADALGTISPITATVAVSSTSDDTPTDPVIPFNCGVIGDNVTLNLWVSRLPNLSPTPNADVDSQQMTSCDVYRISYWVTDGGLARMEMDRPSASDDDPDAAMPPNVSDESKYVIAPEVTAVNFRYFDGTNWQDTWDGTVIGPDEKTPVGPPRAIEVTLTVRRPDGNSDDPSGTKTYRQVIPINAGNAASLAVPSTTTSGSGTSGTGGGTSP